MMRHIVAIIVVATQEERVAVRAVGNIEHLPAGKPRRSEERIDVWKLRAPCFDADGARRAKALCVKDGVLG